MRISFKKYIAENYTLPEEYFSIKRNILHFYGINLYKVARRFGTPTKLYFIPRIRTNIRRAIRWFQEAFEKHKYKGEYIYTYCTKTSHFKFIVSTAISEGAHLELSSEYDAYIIKSLLASGEISPSIFIICNGYKTSQYLNQIYELYKIGFKNIIPVIETEDELEKIKNIFGDETISIGVRLATDEPPDSDFYLSRHGIPYQRLLRFLGEALENSNNLKLVMLHSHISAGISDTPYFWNTFTRSIECFCKLSQKFPTLKYLNIGGGLKYTDSLDNNENNHYIINALVETIKKICDYYEVNHPTLITEFGTYTVADSAVTILKVLGEKFQNEKEIWYIVDSSFIIVSPDNWALKKRFITLPINLWDRKYKTVILGGLSCDNMDFFSQALEYHQLPMPSISPNKPLYIGIFFTGAYQDNLSGYGGLKHCLLPSPAIIIANSTENSIKLKLFAKRQKPRDFLYLLGYKTSLKKMYLKIT